MTNFLEILSAHALQFPDAVAYRFIHGPQLDAEELTYGHLWHRALGLAVELQKKWQPQSRILIACKSQRNFAIAFFGVLAAGMVAVPTAIPRRKLLEQRLALLAQEAATSAVLFDADEMAETQVLVDGRPIPGIELRDCLIQAPSGVPGDGQPALVDAAMPALLQFTSGSTGDPKGVIVTHENLIHNSKVIQAAMHITSRSVVMTALPMFHDMGLVGGLLQPVFSGCVGHCMLPAEFVQYPERWLQAITKFQVTVSGGPDYMFALAARAIGDDDLRSLDLSSWDVAFCGAEPIRRESMHAFAQRFGAQGFRASAFYPCYGMAESTLFITGKPTDTVPEIDGTCGPLLVSCGAPFGDTEVRIVDPESCQPLGDGSIGEIWVRGRSVAAGYWRRPGLSAKTFAGKLAGDTEGGFLRTGDLGYLHGGELYVSGRRKDLIIAYGKKYAPQDIEVEAEKSHPALCEGGAAAFALQCEHEDRVVLVSELKRSWLRREADWIQVKAAMRTGVQLAHGLTVHEIVLIKPGSLPRTSSGKIMRSQVRTDYVAGSLSYVAPG